MKIFGVISLLCCIVPSCTEECRFADSRDVVPTKIIKRKRDEPMILDCNLEGYHTIERIVWLLNQTAFCISPPTNASDCPLRYTEKMLPPIEPSLDQYAIECRITLTNDIVLQKQFLVFIEEPLNPSTTSDLPDHWAIAISSVFVAFFLIAILIGYCVMREIERNKVRVDSGTSNENKKKSIAMVRLDNSKSSKPSEDPAVASHPNKSKPIEDPLVAIHEKIGEGRFVEVFKGYVNSVNEGGEHTKVVVLQKLKTSVNVGYMRDFLKRGEIWCDFEHQSILTFFGKCPLGPYEPTGIVTEFMDLGDLKSFLRSRRNELSCVSEESTLLSFSIQIAAGMAYLTEKNFVHGDLATRNCLLQYLGTKLVVKIANYDMSKEENSDEYCEIGKSIEKFPVRWMSPESILYKKFSVEADAWAYGVLLREVYTFGQQPYCDQTNEQVLKLIQEQQLLRIPANCPATVAKIMSRCWKIEPKLRIKFVDIHKQLSDLQHSNSNYLTIVPS